jgi:hypothetical protein
MRHQFVAIQGDSVNRNVEIIALPSKDTLRSSVNTAGSIQPDPIAALSTVPEKVVQHTRRGFDVEINPLVPISIIYSSCFPNASVYYNGEIPERIASRAPVNWQPPGLYYSQKAKTGRLLMSAPVVLIGERYGVPESLPQLLSIS